MCARVVPPALLAALLVLAACDDDPPTAARTPVIRPQLVLSDTAVMVGETVTYTVRDSATGQPLEVPRTAFAWDRTDAFWPYATAGALTAIDPGAMTLTVTLEGGAADTVVLSALQRYRPVVTVGSAHSCTLATDGRQYCWGSRAVAGGSSFVDALVPRWATVVRNEVRFTSIEASEHHTCGVVTNGEVRCWGRNEYGQLGRAATGEQAVSPLYVPWLANVARVASGPRHGCALTADGVGWCWGDGRHSGVTGDLLASDYGTRQLPTTQRFAMLGGGAHHQCALDADGRAWCWGMNVTYTLGRNTTPERDPVPQPVATTQRYTAIEAGEKNTCAVTVAGALECWGSGVLGDGSENVRDSIPRVIPIPGSPRVTAVSKVQDFTCALDETGRAWCWGIRDFGNFGDGSSRTYSATPVPIGGALRFRAIDVGVAHACGAATDGWLYCWGVGIQGILGTGDDLDRALPARVAFQAPPAEGVARR